MKYKYFKLLSRIFPRSVSVTLWNAIALATQYGMAQSARKFQPIDVKGEPIPWYTYPAIEYLKNHEFSSVKVFEYGSGNSSIFFKNLGAEVFSVEEDQSWYEVQIKNGHKSCIYSDDKDEYVSSILKFNDADVVVIDGGWRTDCARFLAHKILDKKINPAIVIFDNSEWFPEAIKYFEGKTKWLRVDFCGFTPINPYCSATSMFFNSKKKLTRSSNYILPIGGNGKIED